MARLPPPHLRSNTPPSSRWAPSPSAHQWPSGKPAK
jgi:hypothetical protein